MKKVICFDLRSLQIGHENRGIGMHIRSILENLDPHADFEYVFYAYEKNDPIKKLGIKLSVPYTLVQTKTLKKSIDRPRDFIHLARVILHRFTPLRQKHIDVFIQFDFMLGLPRLKNIRKTVLVAYDLIPLLFKEEYIPTAGYAFRNTPGTLHRLKKTLRAIYYQSRFHIHYQNFSKADLLLSISESTAESLVSLLGVPRQKIVTIPLAPVFNTTIQHRPDSLSTKKPFIFYIGATDARKRVSDLIKAYDIVRHKTSLDIDLVLAGKEFSKPKKIPSEPILAALAQSDYRHDIHTVGYITDSEKIWLYRHASAFVFPTMYEGFGLPIIEAFYYNCPVISYNNSSIPEVAGDAALLVTSGDIAELATAIERICSDKKYTEQLTRLGRQRSASYTWKKYITSFYATLDGVLG